LVSSRAAAAAPAPSRSTDACTAVASANWSDISMSLAGESIPLLPPAAPPPPLPPMSPISAPNADCGCGALPRAVGTTTPSTSRGERPSMARSAVLARGERSVKRRRARYG